MRRLMIVEDAFTIRGRGVVVLPNFPVELFAELRSYQWVTLKRPDGKTIEVKMTIEHASLLSQDGSRQSALMIHLPLLKKSDVPIGTELWVTEQI